MVFKVMVCVCVCVIVHVCVQERVHIGSTQATYPVSLLSSQEILNYTCQDLIRVVPFFATASEAFITSIITRVSFDVFLPGDYVTQYGSIGTKMYFIQHGVLDVVNGDGKIATTLCDGSYFGGMWFKVECVYLISVVR